LESIVIGNRVSMVEVLERDLECIHREDPVIRAWTTLAEEDAREQARRLDATGAALPLFGQTIGVKDIIHVAGMPTRAGSRFLGEAVETQDAVCVERLRRSGALILGKTATTEFAFYDPAPTRNPRHPEHTPGGSSSGSAAAVAAGFCTAAIGTQTFGSVIRPASYCGTFALKPTYDAISRVGVIPLASSLDHVGVFTSSAALAAQVAEALFDSTFAGERPGTVKAENSSTRRERLRGAAAGIPDRYFFDGIDSTARSGFDSGLEALRSAGVQVREVKLPPLFEPAIAAAGVILRAEAASVHRRWYSDHAPLYGARLRDIIEAGNVLPALEYLEARQAQDEARRQMLALMEGVDFLVCPSTPTVAPAGLAWTGDPVFNTPFSVAGFPAITLPAAWSAEGLPSGLQVAGAPWSEAQLLRLAISLEEDGFGRFQTPRSEENSYSWHEKKPSRI
jgi:aspartyl-tRNA(Asn)/glutamyl-tRNA(Gln) amidotransferase subunit A